MLREKVSVFDGVSVAIVPSAQPEIATAAAGKPRRLVVAGLEAGDLHADEWTVEGDGVGRLVVEGVTVRPPLRGVHNLRNTMLALAVAQECGVDLDAAAEGIAAMPRPSMRLEWETLGSATLINDAYNANPGSMRAAIELLDTVGARPPARRGARDDARARCARRAAARRDCRPRPSIVHRRRGRRRRDGGGVASGGGG